MSKWNSEFSSRRVVAFVSMLTSIGAVGTCRADTVTLESQIAAYVGGCPGDAVVACIETAAGVGSAAYDLANGGHSIQFEATASRSGPVASVQGETHDAYGEGSLVGAEVVWQVAVTPVGVGLVLNVRQVPVTIQMSVEASASGTAAFAFAEADSFAGTVSDCAAPTTSQCAGTTNTPGLTTLSGFVTPNRAIDFRVLAFGVLPNIREDASFQASADPVLTIADALIPNTDINFRDAFTVTVAPGITQSLAAPVPELPTLPLLALGLGAMFTAVRQSKDARRSGL